VVALMTFKRSWIVVVIIVIVAAVFGQQQFGTHEAPKGQPALVHLDSGSMESFRADFNAAQETVRVIVLLSPT
jgi:hypothetical protein